MEVIMYPWVFRIDRGSEKGGAAAGGDGNSWEVSIMGPAGGGGGIGRQMY
jgi:hypothetical protein